MNDDNQKKPQVVDGVWASGGEAPQAPKEQPVVQSVAETPPAHPTAEPSLDSVWSRDPVGASSAAGAASSPQQTQLETVMPQAAGQPTVPPKKSAKAKKIAFAIVASLLLLGGIGSGAYWYLYNNHPDKILADALFGSVEDLMEQKPMDVSGEMSFKATQNSASGAEFPNVVLQFNTAQSGENSKGSMSAKVSYAGEEYSLGVEAIGIGSTEAYFKVSDLEKTLNSVAAQMPEAQGFAEPYAPIIKKIDGQWIKITEEDLAELGLVNTQTSSECTKVLETVELSKDDEKKMSASYKANQFMTVTEKMGAEDINGQKSEHYKLGFDAQKAKTFTKDTLGLTSVKPAVEACDISEEDVISAITTLDTTIDELRDNGGALQFEAWINKKTRRPTKVSVSGNRASIVMDLVVATKFDAQDVAIQKPQDVIEFTTLMKDIETLMGSQSDTLAAPSVPLSL